MFFASSITKRSKVMEKWVRAFQRFPELNILNEGVANSRMRCVYG